VDGVVSARAIVQARTGSTRLPAKVLLPVGGRPLAALAARRVAHGGLETVVVTSEHTTDDVLAGVLADHRLKVRRGPVDDVHARFLQALEDLEDRDLFVRLTGDNCFPDTDFVRALVTELEARGLDYLAAGTGMDGVPYGLSAEVVRVGAFRRCPPTDSHDREHVTPAVRRANPAAQPAGLEIPEAWQRLRCTIDTLADYLLVAGVMADLDAPESTSWRTLCERLAARRPSPQVPGHAPPGSGGSELVLGTAQLGAPYGIANRTGRPTDADAAAILQRAFDLGVDTIDTARAYGDAETRLGHLLGPAPAPVRVITKLSPLAELPQDAAEGWVRAAVTESVAHSIWALGRAGLDTLLLHRAAHLEAWNGAVPATLRALQAAGRIGRLGISVETPAEALAALAVPEVRHLQLAANPLDHRWRAAGVPEALAARSDVAVHARSVFLQGLLADPQCRWPTAIADWKPAVDAALDRLVVRLQRIDRKDLCIAYVRALPWVQALVLGVEQAAQLEELAALFVQPPLTADERAAVDAELPRVPERVLRPALWGVS
jgi:spore coat polysaccharide biosynthesis protein SpsF